MIYTRSLDIQDYSTLKPWAERLLRFEGVMASKGLNVRKDHEHRLWEYASIVQQLEELNVGPGAKIIDTGSGGSYLPCFLVIQGYRVTISDSMAYGEIESAFIADQRSKLNIDLPLLRCPVEEIQAEDNSFDVSMCVSVIEHVDSSKYEKALRELYRVTKPNGYLFITSDYFRDEEQANASPFRSIQHNLMTKERVLAMPTIISVKFVGDAADLNYKGDFVNNYSFVNICLQKTTTNPSTSDSHSSEPSH